MTMPFWEWKSSLNLVLWRKYNVIPADKNPLGPGKEDNPPHKEDWEYATLAGCLMYLANNTCLDIQYAVRDCARYTHRPKEIFSKVIKQIVGTADRGIIFTPNKDIDIDMFVDADFAGMWNAAADDQDPVWVKSRTGYLILLTGCLLLWCSKLRTEIATTTLEAKFIALSSVMRDSIPARQIVHALAQSIGLDIPKEAYLRSTVFEDNNGCLTLTTVPTMTPRTKHIWSKVFLVPLQSRLRNRNYHTESLHQGPAGGHANQGTSYGPV